MSITHTTPNRNMKKLNFWKEFWSSIPVVIFVLAGAAVSLLQHNNSHPLAVIGGVLLMTLGAGLELSVRGTLIEKAGFGSLSQTKRLLITDEHKLITDGIFGHIRHPLYLGRIVADFGFALFFSSLWGGVLMAISAPCFLLRIRIEEEMLIKEFGDADREYRKHTKRIIPYVY